jgi:hypothetical protein
VAVVGVEEGSAGVPNQMRAVAGVVDIQKAEEVVKRALEVLEVSKN